MLLPFVASAESYSTILKEDDVASIQLTADSLGAEIDVYTTVMDIVSGKTVIDGAYFSALWDELRNPIINSISSTVGVFFSPIILSALFARIFPGNRQACELIFGCVGATMFIPMVSDCIEDARNLTSGIADILEAAVPLLTTLSAMGGGTASSALLTPAAALTGEVMVNIIGRWGAFLVGIAAMCACADSLGSAFSLNGIFSLIKRVVQTGMGFMLALFAGILKVQGMLGASFDSAAVKTARFAVDKLVPAVGGGIADTMDAALSSVMLIKSAVGVTGILLIVTVCAAPVVRISGMLLGIRLAHAIAQCAADCRLIKGMEEFGDVMRLLVIVCMTSITLGMILIGAAIGAGGSISGAAG